MPVKLTQLTVNQSYSHLRFWQSPGLRKHVLIAEMELITLRSEIPMDKIKEDKFQLFVKQACPTCHHSVIRNNIISPGREILYCPECRQECYPHWGGATNTDQWLIITLFLSQFSEVARRLDTLLSLWTHGLRHDVLEFALEKREFYSELYSWICEVTQL